jgi:hypothetical protein
MRVQHLIAGLDVAVNDAVLVSMFQRLGGLNAETGEGAIKARAVSTLQSLKRKS